MKKVVLAIACAMSIAIVTVAQEKAYKAFLNRNKSVEQLSWKNGHTVIVKMKDKTSKTYDLSDEKVKRSFVEAFGEAPPPPPPPPPAPPANIEE